MKKKTYKNWFREAISNIIPVIKQECRNKSNTKNESLMSLALAQRLSITFE
jgi:hypothetical protein